MLGGAYDAQESIEVTEKPGMQNRGEDSSGSSYFPYPLIRFRFKAVARFLLQIELGPLLNGLVHVFKYINDSDILSRQDDTSLSHRIPSPETITQSTY